MSATVDELVLDAESDAVPRARRFVVETLVDAPELQREDAELVVAELVTNAVLHGAPPVVVRVHRRPDVVRVEVRDVGRQLPIAMRGSEDAMTGRGLRLVGCLSRRWGVQPADEGGKTVWAEVPRSAGQQSDEEVGTADEADIDALLASWDDVEDAAERMFTVSLGAVPTDLLLEAKAHIDNLVREFTLAASAATDGGASMPPDLADLVQTVVHDFADARLQIKQQAVAAAARQEPHTELRLTLPASAADVGERYLAALDEADRYARAARLLTLETPQVHRVFRQWYVESTVAQLRLVSDGLETGPVQTFQQRLAAEAGES